MGTVVFILGRSGTGKSYSMRNFQPNELAVINVQGKILPFRNGATFPLKNTDDAVQIVKDMKAAANCVKTIVIDDFQYLMANEFMRRSSERGYDKFTEIARHAWDVVDAVRTLPNDVIVYIMCHVDTDNDGTERLKTIGKMLDEKIVLEGMSTIVLKTNVSDGTYTFVTQNNGKDTVKSPAGMFPSYAIDNDLKYVDEKIRNYYGFENAKTDAEMSKQDEAVTHEEVQKTPTRRSRRSETADTTPAPAPVTPPPATTEPEQEQAEPVEKAPTRRRRLTRDESAVELPFDIPDTTTPPPTEPETVEAVSTYIPEPEQSEELVPRRRRRRNITEE